MNYSEIKSSAAKIATLETAIAEGYRALQSKLKDFQEKKIVHLQVKLNSSFAVLKAEAERIIESYRPYTKPQDAIETVEQKTDEVVASLPSGIIVNNSDYNHPKKSLLVNRHYQPLGIRHKVYDYCDYPDDWWIETALLDDIFPRRVIDDKNRQKRMMINNQGSQERIISQAIPSSWQRDDRGWVYDDGWAFPSKSSTDYKWYQEKVIVPILSKIGHIPFVVGLPDFELLQQHNFGSWWYEGPKRKRAKLKASSY